jgi:iron-sulfur cluster repair protein YtfE (RIC family)
MKHYDIHTRQGLPADLRTLLRDYPRDAWPDHPNFARSIRNWMGAHAGFRAASELLNAQSHQMLDRDIDPERFIANLGYYGRGLVQNLHGHQTWEDLKFFPELSSADDRFDHGLDMLETDHAEMDRLLDGFSRTMNRVLLLSQMAPDQVEDEMPELAEQTEALQGFLRRHLSDEEDLVVPILLHHKMRG